MLTSSNLDRWIPAKQGGFVKWAGELFFSEQALARG